MFKIPIQVFLVYYADIVDNEEYLEIRKISWVGGF